MATVFNQGVLVEWRQGKKLPRKVTFKNSRGFKLVAIENLKEYKRVIEHV